jgi:hypothetical protein
MRSGRPGLGALLPGDEGSAGEREEERLGQSRAHVQRQRIVLVAVRLVGQHYDVGPVT